MRLKNGEIDDVEFWKHAELLLNIGLADINSVAPTGVVSRVLQLLLDRIVKTVHVLLTLGRHMDGKLYEHDACSLLRSCYDAYVQAAYITLKKEAAEEKAQDYLDFDHIERSALLGKVERSNVPFREQILTSPLRAQNEPELMREFNRVAPRFKTNSGGFRKNWYKGDLRSLAEQCGLVEEYDLFLSRLHPSVHSSAYALGRGAGVPHQHITFFGIRLVFRLLGHLGRYHDVTFSTKEVRDIVDSFAVNLFAPPT